MQSNDFWIGGRISFTRPLIGKSGKPVFSYSFHCSSTVRSRIKSRAVPVPVTTTKSFSRTSELDNPEFYSREAEGVRKWASHSGAPWRNYRARPRPRKTRLARNYPGSGRVLERLNLLLRNGATAMATPTKHKANPRASRM